MSSSFTFREPAIDREPGELAIMPAKQCWSLSRMKRLLDFLVSGMVLLFFCIPGLVIALLICLTSTGPAVFRQQRVGRGGKPFTIYKFRSMRMTSAGFGGPTLTRNGDNRVTPVGRWLRKLKLDELPQFYNVLRGEMSLIGPRPKLPQYAEVLDRPYRPGITGAATLAFRCEEELLKSVPSAELDAFYNARIKPLKTMIDVRYMAEGTLLTDLWLLVATLTVCLTTVRFGKWLTNAPLSPIPIDLIERIATESSHRPVAGAPIAVEPMNETAQV